MELVFLALLFLLMMYALGSGYPVAFALPGSAIVTILLAGLTGALVEGDSSAYFIQDGPCLLYTSPSPRDRTRSRMPSSA